MTQPYTAAPRGRTGEHGARTAREVLEEGLSRWRGGRVRIVALEGVPLERQSTYPIERLQATLESGEQLPVIFKRLQAGEGPKGNRRELPVYQRLLAGGRFGAPVLYASVYDEAQGHYWLFLEDVGEEDLKRADWEDWIAAARTCVRDAPFPNLLGLVMTELDIDECRFQLTLERLDAALKVKRAAQPACAP